MALREFGEDLAFGWLERRFGPGRPVPSWLRNLLDETFLWVAGGQLLLALGVRPESVRRLVVLQDALEEARSLTDGTPYQIPRLEGIETFADLEEFEDRMAVLEELQLDDEELARLVPAQTAARWAEECLPVVLDLALEALDGLRARRIRTELVGIDHRAARAVLQRAREVVGALDLRRAAEGGYPGLAARIAQLHGQGNPFADLLRDLEVRPASPRPGEVGRIVSVVHDIPRETLDRVLPLPLLGARPVLATALSRVLAQIRKEWVPPGERGAGPANSGAVTSEKEAALAAQREARRRRAQDRAHDARVDARDAQPSVRRRHRLQTAALGALIGLTALWCLLLVLAAVDIDLVALLGLSAPPTPPWPLPTLLASLAATLAAGAGAAVVELDVHEIGHPGRPRVRPPERERHRRARAAKAARATVALLFLFMAVYFPVAYGIPDALGRDLGIRLWAQEHPAWQLILAVVLPPVVAGVGESIGTVLGDALGKRRARREAASAEIVPTA